MLKHLLGACFVLFSTSAIAETTKITEDFSETTFTLSGKTFTITRSSTQEHELGAEFSNAERMCPPFCVQPMSAGEGIDTVAELEVLDFLKGPVAQGTGLLIDARLPNWYERGTIPGAVNLPFSTLQDGGPYQHQILEALGVRFNGDTKDFSNAIELVVFCNGPWCGQSHKALQALRSAGYPTNKLKYFRGGMESWLASRLSVIKPGE